MKKTIFIFVICLLLGTAPLALAQSEFVPLAGIPGLTDNLPSGSPGIADFLNNLYKFLIGLAAALAVIQIVWAGLDIAIFHKDAVSAITEDKGKIRDAIFGLILVLSPALVFSIINPNILNLSISMPPLDTDFGFKPASILSKSTCEITKSGDYLETARCVNKKAAVGYTCRNGADAAFTACGSGNQSARSCVDGPLTVYCEKSIRVTYRAKAIVDGEVVPRDASRQEEFTAGCNANGGKVGSNSITGTVFSQSCSAEDSAGIGKASCYTVTLTCAPS